MIFVYEYKEPDGSQSRGTITANSKEEAVRSLAKMGINDCLIGEKGGKMERVGTVPLVEQKTVIAAVVEDEDVADDISDIENSPPPQPMPIGWPNVLTEGFHKNAGVSPSPTLPKQDIRPPAQKPKEPAPPIPEPAYIEVRRRQSVLFGQYQTIQAEIQRLLPLFGEVKFMQVVQDMRGNVLMAIVIEHDEPLPKKEEKS